MHTFSTSISDGLMRGMEYSGQIWYVPLNYFNVCHLEALQISFKYLLRGICYIVC